MGNSLWEIVCFIAMLGFVFFIWFKHDGNLKRTIIYTIWTFVIFWLNMPSFFVGIEGLEIKYLFIRVPFDLYNLLGLGYVILVNILLAVAGGWIGNSWEKVNCVDDKAIKKKFNDFSKDASELKIIGRDLDFLGNEEYIDQAEHIKKLKEKAKLLCEQTNDPKLINLYQELIGQGNQIRYYTKREGIANLKGQIKVDMHSNEQGLFATKVDYSAKKGVWVNHNRFEVKNLESGFLLQTVSKEFDRIFDSSLNPVIKCIALDLGGVYFDGDLDDFYDYLKEKYDINMSKRRQDKLNINDKLMLGEIDILDFIRSQTTSKYICKQLTKTDWDDILRQWGETWKPNEKLRKLFEYINSQGICVVPFSNLDKDNGNKYLREHYLPTCCTEYFFSYDQNCCKPTQEAFDKFFEFVNNKYDIFYPFQILLIDDQDKNISMAREKQWYSIKYINGNSKEEYLIAELKKLGIISKEFDLDKI